jgi:signal transduction histidine kinase
VKFAGRLVAGTVVVLFFTILILVWTAERTLRRNLQDELARNLATEARVTEAAITAGGDPRGIVRQLATRSGHRIALFDSMGVARIDGVTREGDLSTAAEARAGIPPEVEQALREGEGQDLRREDAVSGPQLHVAVRGEAAVVRISSSLVQVDEAVGRARKAMLAAALLALAIGSALAFLAGRTIVQPLNSLVGATRAIATGSLPRFPRSGIPDIDGLVQSVRQMHRQLEDRFTELQNEQTASAALVESMLEGVIAADGRGRITTANAAARRLLGYEVQEPLPALQALFRSKAAREVVDLVLAGEAVQDRQLELDDRVVLVNARPLGNDGAVLVLHDLTELRRLETVRRDFVANVSHELKTPLTSISGYAETLLTDAPDGETTRHFLGIIVSNARRMQRLVDDLLDLSRIESGRWTPRPEPVDVVAAIREVWAGLADRGAAQAVTFSTDVAPGAEVVEADPEAVRQVMTNLVDNSLRYVGRGGTITVHGRVVDDGVEVSVADNGIGIAAEHLPRIFERFYRADPSRSREEGGTGLGLAIVKHMVEAHGGRVTAESEIGRGTTVRAWFPAAQ